MPTYSTDDIEEERQHQLRVHRSLRSIQERADTAFTPWGFRAPAPALGCDPNEYRRDLLIKAKKLLPGYNELRHIQIRQLRSDALTQFENLIYPAAKAEAFKADSVPDGEMRKIHKPTANGHEITEWIGKESFVKDMSVPPRRVVTFNTTSGPMSANGQFIPVMR
jgi:hypothetical protein